MIISELAKQQQHHSVKLLLKSNEDKQFHVGLYLRAAYKLKEFIAQASAWSWQCRTIASIKQN